MHKFTREEAKKVTDAYMGIGGHSRDYELGHRYVMDMQTALQTAFPQAFSRAEVLDKIKGLRLGWSDGTGEGHTVYLHEVLEILGEPPKLIICKCGEALKFYCSGSYLHIATGSQQCAPQYAEPV